MDMEQEDPDLNLTAPGVSTSCGVRVIRPERGRGRGCGKRPEGFQPRPGCNIKVRGDLMAKKREKLLLDSPRKKRSRVPSPPNKSPEMVLPLSPFPASADRTSDINMLDMVVESGDVEVVLEELAGVELVDPLQGVNESYFERAMRDWQADPDSDSGSDREEIPDPAPQLGPAYDTDIPLADRLILATEDRLNDMATREILTGTTQDDAIYNFNWYSDRNQFRGQRETFTGRSGPTFDLTGMTPTDIFDRIFDHDFIDNLVTETNRYAQQRLEMLRVQDKLKPSARLHRWTPTDRDEMVTFLALLILQGLYPLHEEQKYFRFNGYGTMPYFSRIMSYNRFFLLKAMYHFVDNTTLTNDRTRLDKIQPVLDHLNKKFSELYTPAQEIVIDESLLKWHGRLTFTQKIATKAAQVGVKTYELCESSSGYLWSFFVHAGKKTGRPNDESNQPNNDNHDDDRPDVANDETPNNDRHDAARQPNDSTETEIGLTNVTAKIVYDLLEPLLDRGHTVIMDNFYNSPLLLRCLKRRKTDCFGTLRLNREFVPDSLKNVQKTELSQGEVVASYTHDLCVIVWRDQNLVSLISTYHSPRMGKVDKIDKRTGKPQVVVDYNKYMGGVDRKDQLLSAQTVERVRNKKWYKKVFSRLFGTAIFNAYVLYKTKEPKTCHRLFRTRLAEDLLLRHRKINLQDEQRLTMTNTGQMIKRPAVTRPAPQRERHFPEKAASSRRRCVHCKGSRTTFQCEHCKVPLCILCFSPYHP